MHDMNFHGDGLNDMIEENWKMHQQKYDINYCHNDLNNMAAES